MRSFCPIFVNLAGPRIDRLDTREERMGDANGEAYRLQRMEKLLELFKEANGREPTSVEDLERWVASPEGRAAAAANRNNDG